MDEINVTNKNHLETVFNYMIENSEETWLGDVTLSCADGAFKLNRLSVGVMFPELEKCQVFSYPTDVYLIMPDFTRAEIRAKLGKSDNKKQNNYVKGSSVSDYDDAEAFSDDVNTSIDDTQELKCEPDLADPICKEETTEYKQTVICDKCQMHFSSEEFLYKHVQYNHVTMQCQICQESQPSWLHLTEHIKIHAKASNISGFSCPKCSKTFPTQVLLDNHFASYHSIKKRYICEDCGKSFESNSKLSDHNNVHHLKVKPYNCKECSYSAAALQTLNHHVKAVHLGLKYTCSICGKVFNHRGTLTTHERTHSECRTTFPCMAEFCGKVYIKKQSLRDHIDECHSSLTISKCKICSSEFKCLRSLKTHMKIHDENKALKCNLCDKKFSTNQQLTYHMNSHTGNKPFKCDFCSSCYSSHSSLYHHKKSCSKSVE